ncbi:MAG: aminotransferase class I/II-fold pyridoxal phosphate-dependent enzyme [Acidobacteriota bacterium]
MKDSKSHPDFVARAIRDIPKSGIRDFFDIVNDVPDAISLGVGEPGFATPWHIRDAAIYALEKSATGYTSNLGLTELRKRISEYVSGFFGIAYGLDEILVTTGVSEAVDLVFRAVLDPGDEVLYHEPCYVSYRPVIQLAQGRPIAVSTRFEDRFRLTADAVAARIGPRTKAIMLNFPNNPTGATLDAEDLEGIAALACEHDLLVVTDEIYSELTYQGEHRSIVSLPGMRDRTLLLHGLSKAWAMTGFRLGYACGPRALIDAMMTIHQYTMLCAPTLSQWAGIEAFEQVEVDVEEMRTRFLHNRNYMVSALREMGLALVVPRGAFYAFPRVTDLGMSSRDFALGLLDEEKVAVVPGEAFGPSGDGFVRCSYATSLENIKEAMERMARYVSSLRRSTRRAAGGHGA